MLIYLDYHGLIQLHWSPLILDEVSRALVDTGRKQTLKEAKAHEARMCDALLGALVSHNTKDFKKSMLAGLTIAQPVEVNAAFRHFRLDLTPKPEPESLWERLERDGQVKAAQRLLDMYQAQKIKLQVFFQRQWLRDTANRGRRFI